jgi:hypothetical protein
LDENFIYTKERRRVEEIKCSHGLVERICRGMGDDGDIGCEAQENVAPIESLRVPANFTTLL